MPILFVMLFILFLTDTYGEGYYHGAFFSGLYSFSIGCIFCYIYLKNKNFFLFKSSLFLTNESLENSRQTNDAMDEKQTKRAAKMIVEKYKHLEDKENDEYIKQYFPRTWEHFDVNEEGKLDADDMPGFMKYLCSDQSIDLDA